MEGRHASVAEFAIHVEVRRFNLVAKMKIGTCGEVDIPLRRRIVNTRGALRLLHSDRDRGATLAVRLVAERDDTKQVDRRNPIGVCRQLVLHTAADGQAAGDFGCLERVGQGTPLGERRPSAKVRQIDLSHTRSRMDRRVDIGVEAFRTAG